ncbi:MAG: PEP-CTERM sorting domain-containing protein [Burkholderiales bacterium]|nr:PEP-CTERM sorting domain-containing protein [Burkholderiales bacterium]
MIKKMSLIATVLLVAGHAHAAGSRTDEGIGFYVGIDTQQIVPSGIYAGVANPNANRLTLLFDHGNHYHGIGAYSLSGDAPGTVLDTNANNRLPETYTGEDPIPLVAGTGDWSGTWRSSLDVETEYRYLGMASPQSLNDLGGSGSAADVLFHSSGNRWSAAFQGVTVGLKLLSASEGLNIGIEGDHDIFDTSDVYVLGDSLDFTFLPIFWTDAAAAAGTYSAEFQLVNLGTNTNVRDGGRFYIDVAVAPVPEPETYAMVAVGLLALATIRRRALKKNA